MKRSATLATLGLLAVILTAARPVGGGVPAEVHYIGHDKVAEVMTKGGTLAVVVVTQASLDYYLAHRTRFASDHRFTLTPSEG